MKLLFIGDIFGEVGKELVQKRVPYYRSEKKVDVVIANAENVSKGRGIKIKDAEALFASGVDVLTSGNHAFDYDETIQYFKANPRVLHPANYGKSSPGKGWIVYETSQKVKVGVLNLAGRIFMGPADCPFEKSNEILEEMKSQTNFIIVDMHAEATSEARALGWHLDGRVSAVLGSHRHVQTADEEILPQGTAYLTDAGMTGPYRSVIGMKIEGPLQKFRTGIKIPYQAASEDPRFCGVLLELDSKTGKALSIERIQERIL